MALLISPYSIQNTITGYVLDGPAVKVLRECCKKIPDLSTDGNQKRFAIDLWQEVKDSKSRLRLKPDDNYMLLQEAGFLRASAGWETPAREEVWDYLRKLTFDSGCSCDQTLAGKCLLDFHLSRSLIQEAISQPRAQQMIHMTAKMAVHYAKKIVNPIFNPIAMQSYAWYLGAAVFSVRAQIPDAFKASKKSRALLVKPLNATTHRAPVLIPNIPNLLRPLIPRETLFAFATAHIQTAMSTMTQASHDRVLECMENFVDDLCVESECCIDAEFHPCSLHGTAKPRSELPEAFNLMLLDVLPAWLSNLKRCMWVTGQREKRLNYTTPTEESKATFLSVCNRYSAQVSILSLKTAFDAIKNPDDPALDSVRSQKILRTMLQDLAAKCIFGSRQGRDHINPVIADHSATTRAAPTALVQLRSLGNVAEYSLAVNPYLAKLGYDVTLDQLMVRFTTRVDKNQLQGMSDSELLALLCEPLE
jgi:hypothetical protein